tara:strand:- start:170 stop:526 length:357 start_codon:yes stop_codon:yes gene_type:complete
MINLKPTKFDAIVELVGGGISGADDGTLMKYHDGQTPPSEEEINAKITELQNAYPMKLLREERNRRLQETDWRFRTDLSPSQEWINYSQSLRDLPSTASPKLDEQGNLINVTWPTKPE